jgi:hypothetical protein
MSWIAIDGEDPFCAPPSQRAVHMHEGQPEMITQCSCVIGSQNRSALISSACINRPRKSSASVAVLSLRCLDQRDNPVVKPPLVLGTATSSAEKRRDRFAP